ncbi:LysR family transcriptional regulator [Ramlibacter algicola]|uniref:LysR family transcriptional regulator n=1 Tax=Ramlibacter algicola TaxID=2795217 RepID=A0A934Q0U1_9BURK|nr:LysR family transcriptional regulator [Ramlibacter algicola]MBK0392552.1 LysR family transcriptional regulator [Ramlibacter algicola]
MSQEPRAPSRARSAIAEISARNLLDSRRLFYFFHVARLGSLSTAEAVLGVVQSAISRQLQQLEADVGEQLLLRTGRGVTLTPAGELLFAQAEAILLEMSATVEKLDQLKRRPASGTITIASPPAFSNVYMPEVVQRFVTTFPDVHLVAYEASTGQVYDFLASGQVDLAIVLHESSSHKLAMQKLVVEPLMVVVGASHPVARSRSVVREKLTELELILPVASHGSRALVETYCEEGGIHLDPRLRLDSLGMTKAVLRNGRFATILPLVACADEVASGELVAIPLAPALKRTVYLASLRDRPQTPHMKAMSREIANVVRSKIRGDR